MDTPTPASSAKSSPVTIILTVLIIVAGAGGFFGGRQYEKSKLPAPFRNANFNARNVNGSIFGGRGFGGQFGAGGSATRGDVTSVSGNTVTVKLANGGSRIVILSSSTQVEKSATASVSDVTVGTTINAIGTANSDGSLTATTVQLNPLTPTAGTPAPAQ